MGSRIWISNLSANLLIYLSSKFIHSRTMATQNTNNVMSCELGKWFSDDKKTAFKVLERTEKSTSIKMTFGNEANKTSGPTIINNEEVCAAKEDEEVEIGLGVTEGEPQDISENTDNVVIEEPIQNECDDNLCQEEIKIDENRWETKIEH